jgi:hypothetical protein|tara:strand:+ start:384 stop:698 length:315 start_codon:yes stop_codon:yes gene_type:complete
MILYNITVNIDHDIHQEWLIWMKDIHIPDVLSTGLFIENKIAKIHAEEDGGLSYSIQYLLKSWEDYNLYQSKFATNLQKKYLNKYVNKSVSFRTVLEIIHVAQP